MGDYTTLKKYFTKIKFFNDITNKIEKSMAFIGGGNDEKKKKIKLGVSHIRRYHWLSFMKAFYHRQIFLFSSLFFFFSSFFFLLFSSFFFFVDFVS